MILLLRFFFTFSFLYTRILARAQTNNPYREIVMKKSISVLTTSPKKNITFSRKCLPKVSFIQATRPKRHCVKCACAYKNESNGNSVWWKRFVMALVRRVKVVAEES